MTNDLNTHTVRVSIDVPLTDILDASDATSGEEDVLMRLSVAICLAREFSHDFPYRIIDQLAGSMEFAEAVASHGYEKVSA